MDYETITFKIDRIKNVKVMKGQGDIWTDKSSITLHGNNGFTCLMTRFKSCT